MTPAARSGSDGRVIRIGTRGSALALAQARLVAGALAARGLAHELVIIQTEGDRRAPDTAWGEGAFVSAIEAALLEARADVAVHSAKDVPTDEDPRLRIVAFLPREDARDALVVAAGTATATIDTLPAGSVVGTDSPRRTGFLRARRPDLEVRPLHGNVDTRLRRLDAGQVDALVLAVAGLVRLGRDDRIGERIPVDVLPPAPGQGAICVQVRADDEALLAVGALIDHQPTRRTVEAERAFLRAAGGGCRAPIGALAEITDGRVSLRGGFATVDGRAVAVDHAEGPLEQAHFLAESLAARLSSQRARMAGGPRVLVTRPREQVARLVARLAELGIEPLVVPAISIEPAAASDPLDTELDRLADYDWVVVTSANGARAVRRAAAHRAADLSAVRWAAIGETTARELRGAGVPGAWRPATASGEALAAELPLAGDERVLLVRGSLADESLPASLRRRGARVQEVVAYRTVEAPAASRALLEEALAGEPPKGRSVDAVIFASPSAVRGLLGLAGSELHVAVLALPAICIGPTTCAAAREAGFAILGESTDQQASALAELTAELVGRRSVAIPT